MNIFGIGPSELILILLILLVVVGPERLPTLARQGGQMLVRTRNWIQRSPDAAMVLRARQEIEQELNQLRMSLVEVQNARNEVIEAAKQINQTVSDDVIGSAKQATDAVKAIDAPKATQVAPEAVAETLQAEDAQATPEAVAEALPPAVNPTNGQTVVRTSRRSDSGASITNAGTPAAETPADAPNVETIPLDPQQAAPPTDSQHVETFSADELRMLTWQVQQLMDNMRALRAELHQRNLLDADWQPSAAQPPASMSEEHTP